MTNNLSKCSWWCTFLVAAFCVVGFSAPATAQVDCNTADLQDLIDYIASIDGDGCGLDIADAAMDISVNDPNFDPCDPGFTPGVGTYFENGFDQTRTLIALSGGNLYLGMRVVGIIGDPDGNGNPDNNVCVDPVNIADEPGIGLSETYRWFLDTNCDGVFDITVTVNNNAVQVLGAAFGGTNFEFSGSDLKVCVTGIDLEPFFQARSFAGHLFDGLGEDLSAIARCDEPSLSLDVEKTVDDVCPDANTTVHVTVTNNSNVTLDPVDVEDTIPAGFTYVGGSSTIGAPGIAGQDLSWSLGAMAPGDVVNFTFMIHAPVDCEGTHVNNIAVLGSFQNECVNDGIPINTGDEDSYEFACLNTACVDIVGARGPEAACPGEPVEICAEILNCSDTPATVNVSIGGVQSQIQLGAGASQIVCEDLVMPADCNGGQGVDFPIVVSIESECGEANDDGNVQVLCQYPDVDIAKSSDVPDQECVVNGGTVTYTLLVTNTGPTALTDISVEDDIQGPYASYVGGSANPAPAVAPADGATGTIGWSFPGPLAPGGTIEITYDVELFVDACEGVPTYENLATVYGYCYEAQATDEDANIVCITCAGEACPHTIGFWRQQCAQKLNGSTKVCLEGMYNLWRCVINETGVINWLENDGSTTSTATYAALSDADLFAALCSQLDGPRPMTLHNMTEIQYLGLMLNVCSGALPLSTPIDNGFTGSVADAIEGIEGAINSGEDLGYWETVADDINNRVGVLAADCELGDDLFRNIEPCGLGESGQGVLNPAVTPNELRIRAYPNPVVNRGGIMVQYDIPSQLGEGKVEVSIFDVSGRKVRTLDSSNRTPGSYSVSWDLRDESGRDVPAGIYFYRLQTPAEQKTQRLIVVQR